MKTSRRQRVTISSMTDRRIDSGLLARRAVKNALSSVRGLYGRLLRREAARRGHEKSERQNRVNEMGAEMTAPGMRLDEEETRNLRNENLENELRELAMRIGD